MHKRENNIAYIDGANLDKALKKQLKWSLDYKRFRIWLSEKYSVKKAYIFIGLMPKYKNLYTYLQECGFTLIFKEVLYDGNGKAKGNCDADLVLQSVKDTYENNFDKAVIVASDGDYACLVKFLAEREKILVIISPAVCKRCSILLKRINTKIVYLQDKKSILINQKEKAPNGDRTPPGSFS